MVSLKTLRCLTVLLMCVIVAWPAGRTYASSPDAAVFRVVVLGSSTAAGEYARPLDSSWVNKFKQYLGTVFQSYEVVNLAVGGFTTFNVMPNGYQRPSPWDANPSLAVDVNKNITKALSLNPSLILINLPTNDSDLLIPANQQLANFDALIDAAGSQGIPVYLSTTQPRNSTQSVRTLLIQMRDLINSRYSGKVMDFWTGVANADGSIVALYNADGTHLNNAGHEVLFQRAKSSVQLILPTTASPNPLAFGNRQVGVPATLPVTLTNASSATIVFDNIYTGTSRFTPDRSSTSLSPGGSVDLQVTFTPPALGTFSDTLFLHNNSALLLMKVPVGGAALAPLLQAAPATLDFGDVTINSGKPLGLTLTNADLNDGSVSNVTSTTGRFVVTPSGGALNRGSSLNLTVTFTPTAFGLVRDTLRFNGTVFGATFRVPVSGNSPVPVLTSSVTELNFGDVDLALPRMLQFTLGNSTINPLELDAVANTQPQFFVDPSSGIIAPNGSIVISVLFAPTTLGVARDTIQVISNATLPLLRIPISGKGVSSVAVVAPGENIPLVFALDQNYPNPFNPATEISFAVPHQERVVVQVFDVLGQEVATVVDDVREAGAYRERFDASGLPSGVYIYRMCAGEFTAARRMILLK